MNCFEAVYKDSFASEPFILPTVTAKDSSQATSIGLGLGVQDVLGALFSSTSVENSALNWEAQTEFSELTSSSSLQRNMVLMEAYPAEQSVQLKG